MSLLLSGLWGISFLLVGTIFFLAIIVEFLFVLFSANFLCLFISFSHMIWTCCFHLNFVLCLLCWRVINCTKQLCSFCFFIACVLSFWQLNDSRRDSEYEKLWKPPPNRGFLPCTKPSPNYTCEKIELRLQVLSVFD